MTASLTFIGTATTLLRLGPFTLLTDPNFVRRGERVHLGYGLTSKRRTDPALTPEQLPSFDALVLSHLHGDHFDRVARRDLPREPPVITTERAADTLRKWGFTAAEVTERFPDVDVLVTHLGGTKVLGVLVTMDGRQGTDLVERVRPRSVVPIHYDDYGVFKSPLSDFVDEMGRRGHAALLRPVGRGQTVDLTPG
jgi:L-ascorbate metabolism protein UlaG (beta-lactamase superfamily)